MNTDRLRISLKYSWIGYALGIAAMVGLFIFALATERSGLAAMAAGMSAVIGAMWAATHTSLKRQLDQANRS